jgi:excinuclease ABC subunit B
VNFKLVSSYKPRGDQPQAIQKLTHGLFKGYSKQCLLGVTGSGKTYTMANIIANFNKPTLVISHNKTLAAQLYSEFKQFFPENAVAYFVSYYDYYQPEAYIPTTDTYIEKDASINDRIERLRLEATNALLTRSDTIIVASVSCIYGLGSPKNYRAMVVKVTQGEEKERDTLLEDLVKMQYERTDFEFSPGKFRVRGEIIEIFPPYSEQALRIEFWGDEIEKIYEIDPLKGEILEEKKSISISPAKHFVTPQPQLSSALESIEKELEERIKYFKAKNKFIEAARLETRCRYDLELIRETGYCPGIENYDRHLSGRAPGERPACLLDYFPSEFLLFIDESHVTIPQLEAMYEGNKSRKASLIEYGFRLPSAFDHRPLKFEEFESLLDKVIFVSATPGPYELKQSKQVVEQIVRPTGLLDPKITVKPTQGQIESLIAEIKKRAFRKQRVLVTTLTKRMAEDLSQYLTELGLRVRYLHSEIDTLKRVEILRELRAEKFDCLVGINLLREGLDLPEVSLVVILDADKEGFLRSETSLIQVAGRAARNIDGEVIMFADKITSAMRKTIQETHRRRKIQEEYNKKHKITPKSIDKALQEVHLPIRKEVFKIKDFERKYIVKESTAEYISKLEEEMREAARNFEFEKAASIRDYIKHLREENENKPKD